LKYDLKRNEKAKGKQPSKGGRPQDAREKDTAVPYKRFNTSEKGHGVQQARSGGREPLHFWICDKDHCKRYCVWYHSGGRLHIYSAHEAHTVGNVNNRILQIYGSMENRHADHQTSIIRMEGKLFDQVVSILIDPGSNYTYINPNLVDKFGLRKEVHAESCLVKKNEIPLEKITL